MELIFKEANAIANKIAASGSNRKSGRHSQRSKGAVKQQLFKKQPVMSCLKPTEAEEKENCNSGEDGFVNTYGCDTGVLVNKKLDVDSFMSKHSPITVMENDSIELSNEDALIPGLPICKISTVPSVLVEDTTTKNEVSKPRKKRKKQENQLIDISDDFEEMNVSIVSSPECVDKKRAEKGSGTQDIEVKIDVAVTGSESKSSEMNVSVTDDTEARQKKHTRLSTYTLDTVPYEKLSEKKRRSLPVVGDTDGSTSKEKKQALTRGEEGRRSFRSRLKPPSRLAPSVEEENDSVCSFFILCIFR